MEEKEKVKEKVAEMVQSIPNQPEKKELTEEEKKKWISFLQERKRNLLRLISSGRVKSINRAIKRNRVTPQGNLGSNRPFNNRANTSTRKGVHSRVFNEQKKNLYEQFKRFTKKQSV